MLRSADQLFFSPEEWLGTGELGLSLPPRERVCVCAQVGAVYMTLGQLTRSAQPPEQSAVVAGRLSRFTRQYLTEVGLDAWLQDRGGLDALLAGTVSVCVCVCVCVARNPSLSLRTGSGVR